MREEMLRARAALRQLQRRSSTLSRRTGDDFVFPPASAPIADAEVGGSGGDGGVTAPLLGPVRRQFCSCCFTERDAVADFYRHTPRALSLYSTPSLFFFSSRSFIPFIRQQTAAALRETLRVTSGYLTPRGLASASDRRRNTGGGGGSVAASGAGDGSSASGGSGASGGGGGAGGGGGGGGGGAA